MLHTVTFGCVWIVFLERVDVLQRGRERHTGPIDLRNKLPPGFANSE